MSEYVKTFKNKSGNEKKNKLVSLRVNDNKLLEKYKTIQLKYKTIKLKLKV